MKKFLKIIIPIVLIITIVIIILVANSKMSKKDMLYIAKELTFQEINEEMENNQTRAKEKYIGNVYLITGYIKEFKGNNIILEDNGNSDIIVTLSKEEIMNLDNGQKVMIVGKFNDFKSNKETKQIGDGSYTEETYTLYMKNAYIEKDNFTITGTISIPELQYYLYSYITGKQTLEKHTIDEWYCSVNGIDITDFAGTKKFTTNENEESTISNVSVKDGDTVTIKGKIIKASHQRGTKEFLYKIKDLEISK